MVGPHSLELLAPYRTLEPLMSTRLCPYYNQACNGQDQLMNHLCFHYQMVLVCPICAGCGSNSWQTIKVTLRSVPSSDQVLLIIEYNLGSHCGEALTTGYKA